MLPHPLPFIQPHLISYHCDELRVGRFTAQVMDGIAEVAIEGIHVSPVPRHLDGVADGALHPAGGGAVFLGDFRVQALGHGVDILRLVHGEQNSVPQELVALDVGGHANLVQYFGDGQLVTVHTGVEQVLFLSAGCLEHPGCKHAFVKGLDEIVGKALVQRSCTISSLWNAPVTKNEVWRSPAAL